MKALLNVCSQMVSIISMNVKKTKLPTTKGFTIVHCRLWNMFTGATLIEIGVFSTRLLNFRLRFSDHWSRPRSPPFPPGLGQDNISLCRGGWLFSSSCFTGKCLPAPSHTCNVLFQVICDLWWNVWLFVCLIWWNLWLPDHKVSLSSFKRYYPGRKYAVQSKDSCYI